MILEQCGVALSTNTIHLPNLFCICFKLSTNVTLLNSSYCLNNCLLPSKDRLQRQLFFYENLLQLLLVFYLQKPISFFLSDNHKQILIHPVQLCSNLTFYYCQRSVLLFFEFPFIFLEAVFINLFCGTLDLNPHLCNRR